MGAENTHIWSTVDDIEGMEAGVNLYMTVGLNLVLQLQDIHST